MGPFKRSSLSIVTVCGVLGLPFGAFAEEIKIFEGYSDFRKPAPITVSAPLELVLEETSGGPNLEEEGRIDFSVRITVENRYQPNEMVIVEIVNLGFGDDSVSGDKRRFGLVKEAANKLKLTTYGYQQLCARGEKKNKWVATRCS